MRESEFVRRLDEVIRQIAVDIGCKTGDMPPDLNPFPRLNWRYRAR